MSDKTRYFWSEITKLKVHNSVISNSIDGIVNVFRDNNIHGTNKLYAILALLFTSFLLHGYSP